MKRTWGIIKLWLWWGHEWFSNSSVFWHHLKDLLKHDIWAHPQSFCGRSTYISIKSPGDLQSLDEEPQLEKHVILSVTTTVEVSCLAHSTYSPLFNLSRSPVMSIKNKWAGKSGLPLSTALPQCHGSLLHSFSQNEANTRIQTRGVRTHLPTVGNNLKQYSFKWFHPWQCNLACS